MSGFSHFLTLQSVPQLTSWSHSKFLPNLACSETRMYSLNNSVLSPDLRHPKRAILPPEFLRNHIVLSWGSCTRQIQLVTFLYGNDSELRVRQSISVPLTRQDCHWWCQDISGGQGLPSFPSPHPQREREKGKGRDKRGPSCPSFWSPLVHQQRRQKAGTWGHSATECRMGEGRRILWGFSWPNGSPSSARDCMCS